MSLRDRLIEAGAKAMPGPGYDLSTPEEDAETVLDAFLNVLAENAVEWSEPLDWVEIKKLIAVLRGDE